MVKWKIWDEGHGRRSLHPRNKNFARQKVNDAISQEKYIDHILKKFGMKDYKTIGTPIAKGANLSKNVCPIENQQKLNVLYAQAFGS